MTHGVDANRANTFVGNVAAAIFGGVGWVLGALTSVRPAQVDPDFAT